jgi:hypothetical protein
LAQGLLHWPQSSGLVSVSTQAKPHCWRFPGQLATQPLAQNGVAPEQTVPQPLQLDGSDLVSTQLAPHAVSPGRQAQTPLCQTWVAEHFWPQLPQLFGSDFTSTQAPPQVAAGLAQTQARLTQEKPGWHPAPQAPQLRGSLARSAQVLFGQVARPPHWQTPFEQDPPLQLLPHWPQSSGSLARTTQVPSHWTVLDGHAWTQPPW